MVYSSWRTGIKLSWDVHWGCRTYLLQTVLAPGTVSMRVNILLRFRSFFRSLLESPSHEVQVISRLAARDIRSNLGSNLALLRENTGLDPWVVSPGHLRQELMSQEVAPVPAGDEWRAPYLQKLLDQRLQAFYSGEQGDQEMLSTLINSLVIN